MLAETAWNGRFFEADPRFWPIAPAALRFADRSDWPAPEELEAPGVRFIPATKPRRSRRRLPRAASGYDTRVLAGEVPTRPRSWHDFLNALVWATFPASKRALHARQARAIEASLAEGAGALPNARSREHDALALLDEGGVIVLESPEGSLAIGFGHALYEGLVCGGPAATASGLAFSVRRRPSPAEACHVTDRLLAARLGAPLLPEMLLRLPF